MTSEGARAGEHFVFLRWRELTDLGPPWWGRAEGIGYRLRMRELLDLADAHQSGSVGNEVVLTLTKEALRVFDRESYCESAFPQVAEMIRKSFRDKPEAWVPGGAGPSSVAASLELLDKNDYRGQLLTDLGDRASKAEIDTAQLDAVNDLLELFDAELIADGHSRAWRHRLAETAEHRWESGEGLCDAISASLDEAHHSPEPRSFDLLVPISELEDPPGGRASLPIFEVDVAEKRVAAWEAPNTPSVLKSDAFVHAKGFLHYEVEAADDEAAARIADESLRVDVGNWFLRGGTISPLVQAFVFDPETKTLTEANLPPEALPLLPNNLDEYDKRGADERPRNLDDALAQLSQARTASPSTALVDLWIATEALFGGVLGDPRHEAGLVMAELAQYPLAADVLSWIAGRLEKAGVGAAPPGSEIDWVIERIGKDTGAALDALKNSNDFLGWKRLKKVTGWDIGVGLLTDMETVEARMKRVMTRAYLIRNAVVHRAEVRAIALSVTLPVFADLFRVAIGHCMRFTTPSGTLAEAKFAAMQARRVASNFASAITKAPEGLHPVLFRPAAPS
ncbi:MAG: hypothetical protein M3198_05645 [Actinomycetota bacterium]|nr:hypothetical protein [Actinomycetota bacterium]